MWLSVTFIMIWALSPGPVAVMTFHQTQKSGVRSGIAIATGATLTSIGMVVGALILHFAGLGTISEADNMVLFERVGAVGIISMGLYAGYKSFWTVGTAQSVEPASSNTQAQSHIVQGMTIMATYIPQALLFYSIIVPQTVSPDTTVAAIIGLGTLKVVLIFGWHATIAIITARTRYWIIKSRTGKYLEVATACLIIGLGINLLI